MVLEINNKRLFLSPNDVSEPLIKPVEGILSLIYEEDKTVIFLNEMRNPVLINGKLVRLMGAQLEYNRRKYFR